MMFGRRDLIRAGAGAAVAGGFCTGLSARSPQGRLLPVNGTRLWVTDAGPRDAPVLLYVHGGPGIGALEFEHHMADALAGSVRLVSVDQRGVLRSDPIGADARVTVDDLLADFEAVRAQLGIRRWRVLGHSFGGTVALRYALAHPDKVQDLVLECPSIDLASSFRWLCASAAQFLNGRNTAAALRAIALADPATPFDDAFIAEMDRILSAMGDRRQDLYVSQARNRDIFTRLARIARLPDSRWAQGSVPGRSLLAQPSTRRPMLSAVRQWKGPLLLIRGEGDHVTSPAELAAVSEAGGRIVTVPAAGHFVHVEQPAAMARLLAA
jgi:proline iminopeptidase